MTKLYLDTYIYSAMALYKELTKRYSYLSEKYFYLQNGYFSDDIYRMPEDKLHLPSIPVYPVSYEDAAHFLK